MTQYLRRARIVAGRTRSRVAKARNFHGRYTFDRRAKDTDSLVLLLAGHKPQLWPWTLQRVAEHIPPTHDVCVVSPGVVVTELREFAASHGWSYLASQSGHVSLAQNLAIRAHPSAKWIHKLDEDIFISEGYFGRLEAGYRRASEESEFAVGLCSPLINVNGYSYVDFLDSLGLRAEWEGEFGPIRRAPWGIAAHSSGDAAVWLWKHALPVNEVAARFAAEPFSYAVVPHRFSIGAILFERGLWEALQGFRVRRPAPGLGDDEEHIAMHTTEHGQAVVVVQNVYAGHFAFGPQMEAMLSNFGDSLASF